MIIINNKEIRNTVEQVHKNKDDIEDLQGTEVDVYTKTEADAKFATKTEIPTKTSDLTNDSFVTLDTAQTITSNKTFEPGQTFYTGYETQPSELVEYEVLVKNHTNNKNMRVAAGRILAYDPNSSGFNGDSFTGYFSGNYIATLASNSRTSTKKSRNALLQPGVVGLINWQYNSDSTKAEHKVTLESAYTEGIGSSILEPAQLEYRITDYNSSGNITGTTTYSYPLSGSNRIAKLNDIPTYTAGSGISISGNTIAADSTLARVADIPSITGLTMYNYKITISGLDSGTQTARSAVYIVSLPYQWDYSSLTKIDIIHLIPVWSVVVDTATTNSKIMGRFHYQTGAIAQIDWIDGTYTFMDFTGAFDATIEPAAPAHW